jgi:FkbM family methyltransferase
MTNAPETPLRSVVEGDVDLVVSENFFPDPRLRGTMVEVGAAKPDYLSVSATFRSRGWRVLSIEPNPYFCQPHLDRGFEVIECACGDADQDDVSFFVVQCNSTYHGGKVTNESFSSLGIRGRYADLMKSAGGLIGETTEIKVKVRRLDTILSEHAPMPSEIDLICVDVEGWELEVLNGLSFDLYRPRVLIIENLFQDESHVDYMAQREYLLWRRLEPNDVFVRRDMI